MKPFGFSLNLLNNSEDKIEIEQNLLNYIEEIQKKFTNQIDQLNLEIEHLTLQNKELKKKIQKSNKESIYYFNNLSNVQECLKIHIETNNRLLKLLKKNENTVSSKILNYFNLFN